MAELPDASAPTHRTGDAAAPDWTSFLDALERDLAVTMSDGMSDSGRVSGSGPTSDLRSDPTWAPPTGLGPLPVHLEDRARALVAATADARAELAAHHVEVGRHLAAVQSVPPAVGSRAPVYLDVAG